MTICLTSIMHSGRRRATMLRSSYLYTNTTTIHLCLCRDPGRYRGSILFYESKTILSSRPATDQSRSRSLTSPNVLASIRLAYSPSSASVFIDCESDSEPAEGVNVFVTVRGRVEAKGVGMEFGGGGMRVEGDALRVRRTRVDCRRVSWIS